ncbi:hypothetical protein [Streptomyces sp. enrichment culture]
MGTRPTAGQLTVGIDQRPVQPEGAVRPARTSYTADDSEEIH